MTEEELEAFIDYILYREEVKDIEKIMIKIKLSSTYGMLNDKVNSKVLEIKKGLENGKIL